MSAFVVPLEQIAALTKGTLMGRPDLVITGVAGLSEASPGDLSFVAGEAASSESTSTRAAALLVPRPIDGLGCAQIVVPNPALAMAQVVEKFFVPQRPAIGVSKFVSRGAGRERDRGPRHLRQDDRPSRHESGQPGPDRPQRRGR